MHQGVYLTMKWMNSPLIDCDPPVMQQQRFGGSRHCLSGSLVDLHSHNGTVNLSKMADVDNLQSHSPDEMETPKSLGLSGILWGSRIFNRKSDLTRRCEVIACASGAGASNRVVFDKLITRLPYELEAQKFTRLSQISRGIRICDQICKQKA